MNAQFRALLNAHTQKAMPVGKRIPNFYFNLLVYLDEEPG
jgi:hypothetical protein